MEATPIKTEVAVQYWLDRETDALKEVELCRYMRSFFVQLGKAALVEEEQL